MDRSGLHTVNTEPLKTGPHGAGSSRGEGDGKGTARIQPSGAGTVGDAVGDGPRLAGTGTCDDAHRPTERGRHATLFGVEAGKDLLWCINHRYTIGAG